MYRLRISALALVAQLGMGEEGPGPDVSPKTMISQDYLAAICLIFAIVGLSGLQSTDGTGGGAGLRRRSPRATQVDETLATAAIGASDDSHAQLDKVASHIGSTSGATPEDSELGVSDERSTAPSLLAPTRRSVTGGKSVAHATSSSRPSKLLFVLNFFLWIGLAVTFSAYSKRYLRDTHDPIGLLVLQGVTGVVVLCSLGQPSVNSAGLRGIAEQVVAASRRSGIAAVLHTGQAVLTNFSVFVGGVAATNALKAMEPVAAAAFSYFLLGKSVPLTKMASFALIVGGILLLTSKSNGGKSRQGEGHGATSGGGGAASPILVSAIFTVAAVCFNALRNVVIKGRDPIPPHQTLLACSSAAAAVGITVMVLRFMMRSMDDLLLGPEEVVQVATGVVGEAAQSAGGAAVTAVDGRHQYSSWLSMDGVNAALCFVGYNFASFNLLASLSPVGHAVGNSVKRVVMFGSGILFLGEVMTGRQLGGTAIALSGVVVYNIAGTRK
ncbi:putative phosphate/phosphoenolpyruvate translocator precursor protein (ISS) [Ectocarpus siliculosus]|uniref:Phosphate/phosphoenolpyruvate translocator protein (ISS) n=1 Tax=Ectocarpus siliculosus TaxID=2880 RepID=D8LG31_ECTSI|nr:putative phosphate/phosphoenolpyruvate translocator precursor protein (ISS) [Ectocarpus siliculosus]|eukprot:CBN78930.1 putative phosphate/phosphoenolpyruvate translocator precursor protein (ISS) [Ectocarpus siliculosus]